MTEGRSSTSEAGLRLAELTTRAVRGQPAAIESLLEHIRPMVVRYCRARLGRGTAHYHVADDVAQEVCIAVFSALPRYRDMGRPFASFVFGIASHKVADAVRATARLAVPTEELPDRPDEQPGPEETVVAWLEAQRARALLDQVAKTYSQDPLWAEQWMEIGQVFLKGAVLALERSETAPSCHDES